MENKKLVEALIASGELNGDCERCGFAQEKHIQNKSGCDLKFENGGFIQSK